MPQGPEALLPEQFAGTTPPATHIVHQPRFLGSAPASLVGSAPEPLTEHQSRLPRSAAPHMLGLGPTSVLSRDTHPRLPHSRPVPILVFILAQQPHTDPGLESGACGGREGSSQS